MSETPKKMDCQLHCKATGQLSESVSLDMCKKDRCLAELLKEEQNGESDQDKPE